MKSLGLLLLRATVGTLLAGHGAQKLFGWFEGPGLEGTTGMMRHMGLRPERPWARVAALSEFGGGVLTALGLLNPLGPLGIIGAMTMATVKAHPLTQKPIWASKGGAELPITNAAAAATVMLAGTGKYSLDRALGIRLPRWIAVPGLAGIAGAVLYATRVAKPDEQPQQQTQQTQGEQATREDTDQVPEPQVTEPLQAQLEAEQPAAQ